MNYAFLPDVSALAMLVVLLLLVRRNQSEERGNAWILGLFITLVESFAHSFYALDGVPPAHLHVVVLDCYVLAGLVFLWGSSERTIARNTRLVCLTLNGVPLLALATTYGLNLRFPSAYIPTIAAGALIGWGTSMLLRRDRFRAALSLFAWGFAGFLIWHGLYRNAVYWALAVIYGCAAFNFHRRLQQHSTGRLAIVTGFSIWAFFFFLHPLVIGHLAINDIASHMWNLQKSLISLGMILVMLEERATSNAYLAHHDELTGLPNRRMFESQLTLAIEQANRGNSGLALVVLDLNEFKKVNDTFGHQAGDHVLREVATALRKNVRGTDTVARMGGDEFIILADGLVSDHSAHRFADALRSAIEGPMLVYGESMRVTASVGLALYPDDAQDAIKLLRIADQRMYHRKKGPQAVRALESTMAALPPA